MTALSLLMFILLPMMWVRSYDVGDSLSYGRNGYARDGTLIRRIFGIDSTHGQVVFMRGHFSWLWFQTISPKEEGLHYLRGAPINQASVANWSRAGFSYIRMDQGTVFGMTGVGVPYWFLTVLFAVLPALWLVKRVRGKQRSPNCCPKCGYDMRATPQRCPECGTPIAQVL